MQSIGAVFWGRSQKLTNLVPESLYFDLLRAKIKSTHVVTLEFARPCLPSTADALYKKSNPDSRLLFPQSRRFFETCCSALRFQSPMQNFVTASELHIAGT